MTIHEPPTRPEQFTERFVDTFNSGDIEQILLYYSDDAVLNLGAGQVFRGRNEIRGALELFLALKSPMQVEPRFQVTSGDTSLVSFSWKIQGKSPEGTPLEFAGTTSDVIHREADGVWRHLLDHPFGTATPV